MDFKEIIDRSVEIRRLYHGLERKYHGSEWNVEEDALAFLTDAGLVGRYTMSKEQRWPAEETDRMLRHKLSECIWWIAVLADRTGVNLEEALSEFLTDTLTKVSRPEKS